MTDTTPEPLLVLQSDDFGGLCFSGTMAQAKHTAEELRSIIDSAESCPNFLSDFVFALEVKAGIIDNEEG